RLRTARGRAPSVVVVAARVHAALERRVEAAGGVARAVVEGIGRTDPDARTGAGRRQVHVVVAGEVALAPDVDALRASHGAAGYQPVRDVAADDVAPAVHVDRARIAVGPRGEQARDQVVDHVRLRIDPRGIDFVRGAPGIEDAIASHHAAAAGMDADPGPQAVVDAVVFHQVAGAVEQRAASAGQVDAVVEAADAAVAHHRVPVAVGMDAGRRGSVAGRQ